jgi:hypothetical protein
MTAKEIDDLLPVVLPTARDLVRRNNPLDQASVPARAHAD